MEGKSLVEMFCCQRLDLTLGDVQGEALVDTLADKLTEVEANTLSDSVGNVNVDTLVHTQTTT